ncbi:hypothetical protein AK830_g4692 [Neonectria ditissima]|uniref:F-box domain-containing protein n=1 Tax=Neonectria ditissima TaxID=78410 RepID=A0A0P7BKM6_9HYPO|nr:hypothetical protein AK830_g4692 [Neonectria ditissima]
MSNPSLEPDALISRLSHQPHFPEHATIEIGDPHPPDSDRASSAGMLDRLPLEIASITLDMLDLKSLSRLASVSLGGKRLVYAQRAYGNIITIAPQVLAGLGMIGLVDLHRPADLDAVLRTNRCAYCIQYGAFLFLPTCERCCWSCLEQNRSLRLLEPVMAKKYFGLSDEHIEQLPTVRNARLESPDDLVLVSVKAAKTLGIAVHGSPKRMAQAMLRNRRVLGLAEGWYYHSTRQQSTDVGRRLQSSVALFLEDRYLGVASVRFPSLSESGEVVDGLWCLGCERARRTCASKRVPEHDILMPVDWSGSAMAVSLTPERLAWYRGPFLEHIKNCSGAKKLLPELNQRRKRAVDSLGPDTLF